MTDLLLAIQTQALAQSAHDQARHGYVLARLLLQQAAGALGEAELATVNQWLLGAPRSGPAASPAPKGVEELGSGPSYLEPNPKEPG